MARRLAAELEIKIRLIINDLLSSHKFEIRSIKIDDDWSGDEAIFVELWYTLDQREFDPKLILTVMSKVRTMLLDNDEERFAYINHHLAEGQKVRAA